jgi:hypothetical protein
VLADEGVLGHVIGRQLQLSPYRSLCLLPGGHVVEQQHQAVHQQDRGRYGRHLRRVGGVRHQAGNVDEQWPAG